MALEFRETVVCGGGEGDFATVRHIVLRGSHREIGRKLAEIARERHGAGPLPPADALVTRCRNAYFHRNYPAHYQRMVGAAEAFGVEIDGGSADVSGIWYDLDVLPGCSVVFYPPACTASGHGILSRNYDYNTGSFSEILGLPSTPGAVAATAHPYLIEAYPEGGIPSLCMCAYDLLGGCLDGVNAHGLTVALLADDETMSTHPMEPAGQAGVGLNEINVLRMLLDTCADVDEAKQALLSHKHYYAVVLCHYLIADRHGRSFVWEYSPAHNREYITDGAGQPQVVTNHPVYRYRTLDELPHEDDNPASSYTRFRTLAAAIAGAARPLSPDDLKKNHACVSLTERTAPLANTSRPRPHRTLWHALYDGQDRSVEISFYLGEDPTSADGTRRSPYQRFRLEG